MSSCHRQISVFHSLGGGRCDAESVLDRGRGGRPADSAFFQEEPGKLLSDRTVCGDLVDADKAFGRGKSGIPRDALSHFWTGEGLDTRRAIKTGRHTMCLEETYP